MNKIKIFLIFIICINYSFAHFLPGDLINPTQINQKFEEVQQKSAIRGQNYEYNSLNDGDPIHSSVLNQNFNNFKQIIPNSTVKQFDINAPIKADDFNFNFNSMNQEILTYIEPSEINDSIDEVNAILSMSEQPLISSIPENQVADFTQLNTIFNSLKKYDPNNTILSFNQSAILKVAWDVQIQEAKRVAQHYYDTCVNLISFSNESNSSTCSLARKIKSNLNYLNNYFPFYGDSVVSFTLADSDFIDTTAINNIFNSFNNKTNKINSLTTYTTSDTISASSLNLNFSNLRENIKQKLEAAGGVNFVANSSVKTNISGFTSQETNKNSTVYFKIEDTSKKKVEVSSTLNGTTCVNNEYCKTSFTTHATANVNLVNLNITNNLDEVTSLTVKLFVDTTQASPPYRTGDWGCGNADWASHPDRNIWACDGGGSTCTRFCHRAGFSGGGCLSSSNGQNVFDAYYNTAGKYQYVTWAKVTGDLRGGCGGNYVYGVRIYFNKQAYSISP